MKQLNWYQIFGKSNIPDGRTVLPTDDIQIWLHCANIWNKTYTTLAEVLADTDTLLALINSSNAVDYMVRSTTWAVAMALVPTMTSDTTPSGECSASSTNSRLVRPAYMAFDGIADTSHFWGSQENSTASEEWVSYKFTQSVVIARVEYTGLGFAPNSTVYIESSDDDFETSNLLGTYTTTSAGQDDYTHGSFNVSTVRACDRVRVRGTKPSGSGGTYAVVREVQFYSASITDDSTAMSYIGLNNYCANTLLTDSTWLNAICNSAFFESVLNVKVPKMTSNTTPSGIVSASSYESSITQPYKAFDGSGNYYGWNSSTNDPAWIDYQFTESVAICCVWFDCFYTNATDYTVKVGDDVNNLTEITTLSPEASSSYSVGKESMLPFVNSVKGTHCRLATSRGLHASSYGVKLQFYGREDV